jgi:hypothetical protein
MKHASVIIKEAKNETKQQQQLYYEPHLLELMMIGIVKVVKDPTGAIFINRNPKYFEYILDYLRAVEDEEEFDASYIDSKLINKLIIETEHFNLMSLRDLLTESSRSDVDVECSKSSILKQNKLQLTFNNLVKDKAVLKHKKWTLLYRATEDGFAAADFHRKCDNKGATLIIIKSRDHPNVFGGFAAVNWDSLSVILKIDPNAFIFSLINSENRPLIANCSYEARAILCSAIYGPVFGGESGNREILIYSNAHTQPASFTNFPVSFKADGLEKGTTRAKNFLAGSHQFFVSEIEVFQIASTHIENKLIFNLKKSHFFSNFILY